MSLSIKPTLKIVATILAKNEEDVIGKNIEHHIEHGVSQFIITDNNSSDNTKSIAGKYPEVVEIIDEKNDTHHQSKWVTRMAQIACKLNPDWIIHLDADELWGGLQGLREIHSDVVSCERMFLHPPVISNMFNLHNFRYYLNFDDLNIPQECKIAHRPNPNFVIEHGNHAIEGISGYTTKNIFRHHYPIRTLAQWQSKSEGHLALMKRDSLCVRWEKWHKFNTDGSLNEKFNFLCDNWEKYRFNKSHSAFVNMLDFWATPEMITHFKENKNLLPSIGEWPKHT